MGWQIYLSSLIVFAFSLFMFSACQKTSRKAMVTFWAYIALISLVSIPIGLIIQIWQ